MLQLMFSAHSRARDQITLRRPAQRRGGLAGLVGRRLAEYQFPAFGWGCLLFILVSLEGERGLVSHRQSLDNNSKT